MTGSVVDMAPFWAWIAAPALTATLAAAGYLWAAWKWPALRTPIAAWRVRRRARWLRDVIGYQADGKVYHPADVTIIRKGRP